MSLEGVRTLARESAGGLALESRVSTSSAIISSFESRHKCCDREPTCCAVESDERLGTCHRGRWSLSVAQGTWSLGKTKGPGERAKVFGTREHKTQHFTVSG